MSTDGMKELGITLEKGTNFRKEGFAEKMQTIMIFMKQNELYPKSILM